MKEDALFYKFKASNDLAVKSVLQKKETRINNALEVHDKFIKIYPESKNLKEVASLHKNLEKELKLTQEQTKLLIENFKNNRKEGL